MQSNYQLLYIIFAVTGFGYVKFAQYNLKVSHRCHICKCQHVKMVYIQTVSIKYCLLITAPTILPTIKILLIGWLNMENV